MARNRVRKDPEWILLYSPTCAVSVLAVIRRMQEQNSNGYNVVVRDGSMKTVLIIMILI